MIYSSETEYNENCQSYANEHSNVEHNNAETPIYANCNLSTSVDLDMVTQLDTSSLKSIHKTSDDSIDWTEVLVSPIAFDETYNQQM